jgi:hypothetical protein
MQWPPTGCHMKAKVFEFSTSFWSLSWIRYLLVFLMLGFLSSCASVPITSMIQLAAMGSDGLEQLDPSQIRVRVSVSSGFEIDVARTRLGFSIARPDGSVREEKLSLELVERTTMERSPGLMRRPSPMPTYVLRLIPADVKKFSDIRKSARVKGDRSRQTFSVTAPFSKTPQNPKSVKFWADLRFSHDGSWIALLDGAELDFKASQ